ncbi:hypothetical protein L2E82_10797 [Cichorium intybus]|uniref:Uncharacterized protein n=1 Tax=Cichorium intybus TaxID=13427 RepID=A0ACB9GCS5_CICIN|nr:hypothetical protein L2E82_10797 [Cichorium intybus]
MATKVATMRTLMGFVAMALLMELALAVDHTVGAPNGGWDLSTDMQTWASSQTFAVGDNLVFQYSSTHDVLEVSKANYDSCSTSNPISTNVNSPTRIPLTASGNRYFICGIAGHCSGGMKVEITTAGTSPAPPQTTTPSAPTPPTDNSSPPPPPVTGETVNPPAPSSAITLKATLGSILGFGFLVVMLLSL